MHYFGVSQKTHALNGCSYKLAIENSSVKYWFDLTSKWVDQAPKSYLEERILEDLENQIRAV